MDQTMQPLDKTNQPLDWINQTSGGGALNEVNRAVGRANQTEEEEAFKDAVVKRLIENIDVTKSIPDPQAVRARHRVMLPSGLDGLLTGITVWFLHSSAALLRGSCNPCWQCPSEYPL